jgi:hypothetical protein
MNGQMADERARRECVMASVRKTVQLGGRAAPALAAELGEILRLIRSLLDPYRPELHYMRGPGPKWHAKHRPAAANAHPAPGLSHVEA